MAFLVVANLPAASGIPADAVTNTFAVAGGDPASATSRDGVLVAFGDFYSAAAPVALTSLGEYLGGQLSRAALACTLKLYDITNDLAGTPHGSPIGEFDFTLDGNAASDSMPNEVACVVTLEAIGRSEAQVEGPNDTRPRQRRSGRVFFGPLARTGLGNMSTTPTIATGLITHFGAAFQKLQDDLVALGAGESLGVWSRTDATVRAVEAISVDNAPDIQRRRGIRATSRTRFVL